MDTDKVNTDSKKSERRDIGFKSKVITGSGEVEPDQSHEIMVPDLNFSPMPKASKYLVDGQIDKSVGHTYKLDNRLK